MEGNVSFSFNSAKNGGAMNLKNTNLIFKQNTTLETSYNNASDYGGAIYYKDEFTANQCGINGIIDKEQPNELEYCFLMLQPKLESLDSVCFYLHQEDPEGELAIIHSSEDSAGKDGSFL